MSLKNEFRQMITRLSSKFSIPQISDIFLPPFHKGGQPKDAQFMAISLTGGAAGVSYILLPDEKMEHYNSLKHSDFIGKTPQNMALEFGNQDPVKEMISLAAINAICQHVMRKTGYDPESTIDSLGLLSVSAGDRVGMVGLFSGLVKTIKDAGADLVIVEKKQKLIKLYPDLPITLDTTQLGTCNNILCTSTTILNNTLDDILTHCSPDACVTVVGPTAGYFPDPLFARGIGVVGGRVVKDGDRFMHLLKQGKQWGDATQMTCFQKETYVSMI